jgi:hypothetical protein
MVEAFARDNNSKVIGLREDISSVSVTRAIN